jgi:small subunit ribosomal protein S16
MPTKIRLQRHGKKRYAFFHIVIADSRAPRDGKFIEKIGVYNPNTDPATIELDFDRALHWVKVGAQPTDTVRAILKYKGVMHKDHLDRGVAKGALTQEEADKRFEAWLKEKEAKIEGKKEKLTAAQEAARKAQLEAEKEINKKRAEELAAKNKPVEEAAEESAPAEETTETTETPEASTEEKSEE